MDRYRPSEGRRPPPRESDSYWPRRYDYPPPPLWQSENYGRNDMYHFQGSRDRSPPRQYDHRPRPGYQSARPPPGPRRQPLRRPVPPAVQTAANRPLFRFNPGEAVASSVASRSTEAKFRNVDDLTDSEEENDDDYDPHPKKRIRLEEAEIAVAPASKWSNPDPYTSLPAGDVAAKRTDVVKLIRKARIDSERSGRKVKHPHDFISFDAAEHDSSDDSLSPSPSPPIPHTSLASTGARAVPTSMVTGKRKRGPEVGDEGRHPRLIDRAFADGSVQDKWHATPEVDWTPWLQSHPLTDPAGIALHKEILDFYSWVKPKPHEAEVRDAVFRRLQTLLQKSSAGELKAFGSYAAGLYLPNADMDLVYLTRSYRPGAPSKARSSKLVNDVALFLRRSGIAQGPVIPISHAKVPIIKFVDRVSGLRIDLSFDNDSGVVAIDSFHKWTGTYPIMPIVVSVLKQYLMIRGLNDVSTGGLGGFSAICLVTSFLQHFPNKQHPVNLGDTLLEFFNFYGNILDQKTTILRLDPPAYLDKATYQPRFNDKDNTRLTIIDPHRSDNNISGGTKQIDVIFKCFSRAHSALVARLAAYEEGPVERRPESFLGCLIGGNFTPYEKQREILRSLSVQVNPSSTGDDGGRRIRETARSVEVTHRARRAAPDRSNVTTSASDATEPVGRYAKSSRGTRRAQRMKELRPDLAASIRTSISLVDALKLGGYKTPDEMDHELSIREVAAAKLAAAKQRQ